MATYSYKQVKDVISLYASSGEEIARVLLFPDANNYRLNGFDIKPNHQGQGLAYALAYLGMQKLISVGATTIVVPDCNTAMIATLRNCTFDITDLSNYLYKGKNEQKGRATSTNVAISLAAALNKVNEKAIYLVKSDTSKCAVM